MRISDWSSDVCSSDLVPRGATEYQFAQARMAPRAHDEHVGATIGDGREEYVADGGIVSGCIRGCCVDAVTAEVRRDVGAKCMLPFVRARPEHGYSFRFLP